MNGKDYKDCVFCNLDNREILFETTHCRAFFDKYPTTEGHTLILPKRHIHHWFQLTWIEQKEIISVMDILRVKLKERFNDIEGWNFGSNIKEVAGATQYHCHLHLIPRRSGDTLNPTGGVRGCVPEHMVY